MQMNDRQKKRNGIRIKIDIEEEIIILFFCVSYILAIYYVLKPNLMSADIIVTSYSKDFSFIKSILSIILVFFTKHITYNLVNKEGSFSFYLIRALFFLYEVPVILSFGLFYFPNYHIFWVSEILYWLMLCGVIYCLGKFRFSYQRFKVTAIKQKCIRIAILLIAVIGLLYSFRKIGNVSISLSLSGIYRIRAAFKENTNELITFFKTAFGGYLCPGFIVFYCTQKKYKYAALMVVLQGFFYFMARDKTYLFLLPIALLLGIFACSIINHFPKWLKRGYLVYGFGLLLSVAGFFRDLIFEIVTRRIQVMPAFFNYIYYDYFSKNEPIWWRQDTFLIDKLFNVVYPRSVPLQISHVYFNDIEGNPNAGMFAEAISRCGYAGIIIYPLLLGFVVFLVDRFYTDTGKEIKLILAICFAMSISNDVITSTSFVIVLIMVLLGSNFFRRRSIGIFGGNYYFYGLVERKLNC